MKTMKRTLSVFLVLVMLLSALPLASANAQSVYKELILNEKQKVKLSGDDVILSFTPENDGWYEFCATGDYDTYATLTGENYEEIFDDDSGDSWNFKIKAMLCGGEVYYLSVNSYEADFMQHNINVSVAETVGVKSVKITQYPTDMTCIEGYEVQTIDLSGLKAEFTFTDGTVGSFVYDDGTFDVNGNEVLFNCDEDENGDFYCEIICCGVKERIYYTTVESSVERIELITKEPIKYYENTKGYHTENGTYYYGMRIPDDAVLNVYYKDGEMETLTDFRYNYAFRVYSTQDTQPWGVGTNYFTASYLGTETLVPVEIVATPIKSVKVNSAPTREYVYADEEWGYTNEVGRYEFWPTDLKGLSFTVEYLDGTTETFDDADFDIDNETIAGDYYTLSDAYTIKAGKVPVTLTFKGFEIKYNVNVVDSSIRDMEVIWGPDKSFYEERFDGIFDGAQIRLTLKDGSEKIITMSDENTDYGDGYDLVYTVTEGDIKIRIYKSHNEYNEVCYWLSCLDKGAYYDGLYYEENREIADITVDKFTLDGDSMVITVNYTDGSVDTLNYETVSFSDYKNGKCYGFAKTEGGITGYDIAEIVENGEVVSYKLNVLGEEIIVDNPQFDLCDVDMDGEISVMDATSISFHLALLDTLSSKRLELADADKDGCVSIMDATKIQFDLAGLEY